MPFINKVCGLEGCIMDGPHGHGADAPGPGHSTPACAHRTASLLYAEPNGRWKCDGCDLILAPAFDMVTPEAYETALDGIAAVFTAVLDDYTQRMQERFGLTPKDFTFKGEPEEQSGADYCEEHGHVRDHDGICQRCGDNPFLGTDEMKDN